VCRVQEIWYALVANSEFMFNDVQNEALAEQLREKKRFYNEQVRCCSCDRVAADLQAASKRNNEQAPTWHVTPSHHVAYQHLAAGHHFRAHTISFWSQNKEVDFFLVSEPVWLDERFSSAARQVRRPCAALVSTDQMWIT
jgi:acyl-CoA thioesterase